MNCYIWYPEYEEIAKQLEMEDVLSSKKKALPVGIYDRNGRYRVYFGDSNLGTYPTLDEAIKVRQKFMESNVSPTRL